MSSAILKVFWRHTSVCSLRVLSKREVVWVHLTDTWLKLESLLAEPTQLLLDLWHEQSRGTSACRRPFRRILTFIALTVKK